MEKNVLGLSGLLPIYKPTGMISKDVSRILQRNFGKLKLGHVGTLDPLAEGVLPIVIGKATRLQDYLLTSEKIYDVDIAFGYQTDTLDVTGEVVKKSSRPKANAPIEEILEVFKGKISQIPPIYSAVKYQGKPLYEYARSGKSEEVPLENLKREIEVYDLELLSKDCEGNELKSVTLRVNASKGTYVRVLAFDIAERLGTLGTMTALKRIKTAGVDVAQCINIKELVDNKSMFEDVLVGIEKMPLSMIRLVLDDKNSEHLRHGRVVHLTIDQLVANIVESTSAGFDASSPDKSVTALLFDDRKNVIGIGEISPDSSNINLIKVRKKRGL